ncbi:MAG TPA: NUDIX hydrolase [Dehalococcoidia bacterium]|nr:NUDIX hydrolase [Dehalococcoidia bacterium]
MEGRRYIVNVEAFVYHEGRYLMIVRGATEEIAPGTLTPPGGKVDAVGLVQDVLEKTLRREVLEEAGVEVEDDVAYVESHSFDASDVTIVDLVFLARYRSGEPSPADAEEVAGIEWLTYDEVMADSRAMPWTRESLKRAEAVRRARGW